MKTALRILNIEDNANDAELNEAMLSARWPHSEFVRVDSRDTFLAELEKSEFDLILCDYTMPGFSGIEALGIAHEKAPNIPFMFVSGTIGEDAAIEALKNGATDYVLKHRLMRLIPAVDRALRESAERAERLRAEESMRQSEYKYRELFENLSEAAFLADEKSGKIIDTNRCAEVLLHSNRSQILGRKQSQFLALDNARPRPGDSDKDVKSLKHFECDLLPKDGQAVPVSVHSTRLTLYNHPLVLWLCREINSR